MTDYHGFSEDRDDSESLPAAQRAALEEGLQAYLDALGLAADWEAVKSADDDSLVTTLCSVCPFDPAEKQALLEAPTLVDRANTLLTLMRFAAGPGASDRPTLQ
jgi:hypothetical protein